MFTTIAYSEHALERMASRDLSDEDLEYVLWFGRRFYNAGALCIFLGSRDIPHQDKRNPRLARLEGTTILMNSRGTGEVITVYRNRRAIRGMRRKAKYGVRRSMTA